MKMAESSPKGQKTLWEKELQVLEHLYRFTGLIFLLRGREDFNLYRRNTTMKFGKSLVNMFREVFFLKKKLTNAHMHACTHMVVFV